MAHDIRENLESTLPRDIERDAVERDNQRLAALDGLARSAYELGLYDRNVFPAGGRDE